jgi:hypothetical protein
MLGHVIGGGRTPPTLSTTLIFVIDALDECEYEDNIRTSLQFVDKARDLDNIQL